MGGCQSSVGPGGAGRGGDRVGARGVMALVAVQSWLTALCEYVSCVDDGRARSVVCCTGSLESLGGAGGGRCSPANPHPCGLLCSPSAWSWPPCPSGLTPPHPVPPCQLSPATLRRICAAAPSPACLTMAPRSAQGLPLPAPCPLPCPLPPGPLALLQGQVMTFQVRGTLAFMGLPP